MKSHTSLLAGMIAVAAVLAPASGCQDEGSQNGPAALNTFAAMREIVGVRCAGAGCHSDMTAPKMVDDAMLYETLTTFVSTSCGNRKLVTPGAPMESAFYLAQSNLCGASLPRMPLGCVDNCTPQENLDGIRDWIAKGAPQQ